MGPKITTTNIEFWSTFNFFSFLPHTEYAAKNQKTFEIKGQLIKTSIFVPVPKSHTQMGSLSVKNASEKFSRLGTFNKLSL
jgi:hypothetical protein